MIAATLQLNARMPKEHAKVRALYSCLCQQHAYRLTRHAVVGDGSKAPVDLALRERGVPPSCIWAYGSIERRAL